MNWKFWKKEAPEPSGHPQAVKLDRPKDLPEPVGRKMVVGLKMDPDWVWSLKYISRPAGDRPKTSEFRIFSPEKASHTGVVVKNWTSLDDRPDLILYHGFYEKNANRVEIQES